MAYELGLLLLGAIPNVRAINSGFTTPYFSQGLILNPVTRDPSAEGHGHTCSALITRGGSGADAAVTL